MEKSVYKDARLLSKYISLTIIAIIFLFCLLATIIGFIIIGASSRPIDANSKEQKIIEVSPNTTTEMISDELEKKKIIRNSFVFKYYLKLNNISTFQAGEYKFSPAMSTNEIAKSLESGKVFSKTAVQFEIKSGSTIELIAATIEENTSITREQFMKNMRDKEYIEQYQEDYPKMLTDEIIQKNIKYPLEGYLSEGIYQFPNSDVTVDQIVKEMLKETYNKTYAIYKDNGAFKINQNYEEKQVTFHEYLTLSSIVESEMKTMTDKARYISLLINRLENHPQSALNSDATVKYAVNKEPNDQLDTEDYNKESGYNTYNLKGLPIGPINNISKDTANTTINPPKTNYYYYTENKSGKILFAETLAEQEKNRNK